MKDSAKKDGKSGMKAKACVGRSRKGAYDDEAPMKKRRWIPEAYRGQGR